MLTPRDRAHAADRRGPSFSRLVLRPLAGRGPLGSRGRRNIPISRSCDGDSYDNALAKTIFGLFKAELIRPNGPWRSLEEVEFATLEWVDWFNNRRLVGPIGDIPPAEFEAMYYERQEGPTTGVGLN
jgi:transposase InsO family protein